ncbi:hypothetical protein, partial [Thiolapillus sp.]|uniref:hypothetical protein n=1 Tax=Thiolapillus sp. TaxID=2017437 RepID=UPI003AF6FB03
ILFLKNPLLKVMRDKKMDGFNSNEDAPEYNQLSFARGADARRNGKDLSDNPFPKGLGKNKLPQIRC